LIQLVDTSLGVMARHRQGHGLVKALQKIKPKFALYWIAAPETAYQVSMWLPYLERLNEPFVIIVRSRVNFEDVRALTKRPIVICRYQDDLDSVVVPSLRAVFYTNNSPRNMHMVRFPGIKHIQLNHGDSDKAPSFNPVFRMYDKNFVAGQAAIDRFAANGVEMQRDDFVIVGRPQVENVNVVDTPISDVANPTVLYAPTWYGFNADSRYSSLAVGPLLIEALLRRGVNVIFRPHPYARRTATYAAAIERIYNLLSTDPRPNSTHVFGKKAETEWSVFDCFNAADAMISDVSSVVNDFLYSGKPIAMMAVDVPAAEFPEVFPVAKACYIIEARSDQLVDVETPINRLLGTDPLRSQRLSLRTHYLGDFPSDGYANHFLQAALEQIQ
jgi:hypothetical protein